MDHDNQLVMFRKYETDIEANIVMGVLESNGINACVMEDRIANVLAMNPVNVWVRRRDLDRAAQIVDSMPEDGEMPTDE